MPFPEGIQKVHVTVLCKKKRFVIDHSYTTNVAKKMLIFFILKTTLQISD